MASDHPASSRPQQPHAGPQPAPEHAHGDATSPPSKQSLRSWWTKFKTPPTKSPEQNVQPPTGIFGVPLRQSITYANVAISLVDAEGRSYIYGYVPIVVAKCGVFLKEKATNVEGIFRLSGSEKRIKELRTVFDSPDRYGKGLDWAGYTVHDAANVLRRYLNQLPEPIVPLDLYERFREPLRGHTKEAVGDAEGPQLPADFDIEKAIVTYQQLITDLPPLNRQLLLYILDLLAVFASKSDENRMTSANLAAIFQPGMLSHPSHDMAPEEYRLSQDVLIFLIENQDHFLIGMKGTAADEQTVHEVQNGGTPPPGTPNTPGKKTNVARSASNASAGADSIRKFGGIRRNVSVSSRHSRQSNGAPSPASPAYGPSLTSTTGSGVHRSNTVPSKRSPNLTGNRLQKNSASPSPTTPAFATSPSPSAAPRGLSPAPLMSENRSVTSSSPGLVPTALGISTTGSAAIASQERLLADHGNTPTPTKERNIANIFQRSPTTESDRKPPNKLRKKRIGSSQPSAHSSTQSFQSGSNMASPPLYASRGAGDIVESSPLEPIPSANPGVEHTEATPPATTTPRADQTSHPFPAQLDGTSQVPYRSLKPASPPTSLHSSSSFNDQSDADRLDDMILAGEPKEKRRLFRLSRHRDVSGVSLTPTPKQGLGSDAGAGQSSTSVSSSARPRKSWTGETVPASSDSTLVGAHLHSSSETEQHTTEEKRGPFSRLWDKVRENKEERDAKKDRNKSPPGSNDRLAQGTPRGKSMDVKRDERFETSLDGPSTPRAQQPPPR